MPVAETLGVVGSIIAIIQISDRIIGCCKFYIQAASDTPPELRAILVEVSTLKSVLESLQFLETCAHSAPALWKQLSGQDGPIEECRRSINALEKLFPADQIPNGSSQSVSKRRKVQRVRASLQWPFKAPRAQQLLQTIIQQKTMISLALTTDSGQEIKSIKKDTAEIRHMLSESQRGDVYRWLETTDPSRIHNRSWKLHEPQTSSWMLRSPDWDKWLTGDLRCLWIHGIPGAGKTILTSFLVEQLKTRRNRASRSGHAYYYCYFGHNQDEAFPFLTWIIAQLCRQSDSIPGRVYELYKQGGQPSLTELLCALEASLQSFDIAHIILDAADESMPREDLLRVLRDLATDARFSKIHCLITSRRYIDIEQALEPVSGSIPMSNALVDEDIRKHVHSVLHSKPKFQHWPSYLLIEVEEAVVAGSKGMFRWAVCQLECLQRLKAERQIVRKALATLPKTLDETYERILMGIPRDEWPFARHALQWVCFHQDLYEGNHALSLDILLAASELTTCREAHQKSDLDYDAEGLRGMLGCLITVDESDVVFLAHYTVREYLEAPRISQVATGYFRIEQETILKEYTHTILQEAQAIERSAGYEPIVYIDDVGDTPEAFLEDFLVYCVVSGAMLLTKRAKVVASDKLLMSLAVEFVNPKSHHFDNIVRINNRFQSSCFFSEQNHDAEGEWRFPSWEPKPDCTKTAILLQLLLLSNYSDVPVLASAYIEGRPIGDFLQSKLNFTMGIDGPEGCFEDGLYRFDGSLIEVMAHLACVCSGPFIWLVRQCELSAMSTGLLLAAVGLHIVFHNEECQDQCILEKFLSGQADPNAAGYSVTPLQIAVANNDITGVKVLLDTGVCSNAVGDPSGMPFKTDSILECFNQLRGLSPLYICQSFRGFEGKFYHQKRRSELRRKNSRTIEALLLEHSAVQG